MPVSFILKEKLSLQISMVRNVKTSLQAYIPLASHLPPNYVAMRTLRIAAYHDQLYPPSCYLLAGYLHAHLEALQNNTKEQIREVNLFVQV